MCTDIMYRTVSGYDLSGSDHSVLRQSAAGRIE